MANIVSGGGRMSVDVVDYLTLPSMEEWKKFNEMIESEFPELQFSLGKSSFNLLEMINGEYEVNHWKNEFNWRIFNIGMNFVFMMHHYEKGIPDDQYANLKGEKLAVHIWFAFYAESLVSRLVGTYDILFHIANVKYKLKVNKGMGFNRKVLKELESENTDVHDLLMSIKSDDNYIDLSNLRNDFIHNNSPANLDSGIKESGNGVTAFGKGHYVKSSEIIEIFKKGLEHLQTTVIKFDELL